AKKQMMQSPRESLQQNRRVYVGNLPYDVKWHHLKDFTRQWCDPLGAGGLANYVVTKRKMKSWPSAGVRCDGMDPIKTATEFIFRLSARTGECARGPAQPTGFSRLTY
ncbi:hypothetical protein BU16DRAFT_453803, partial [Lophium mytilinum]